MFIYNKQQINNIYIFFFIKTNIYITNYICIIFINHCIFNYYNSSFVWRSAEEAVTHTFDAIWLYVWIALYVSPISDSDSCLLPSGANGSRAVPSKLKAQFAPIYPLQAHIILWHPYWRYQHWEPRCYVKRASSNGVKTTKYVKCSRTSASSTGVKPQKNCNTWEGQLKYKCRVCDYFVVVMFLLDQAMGPCRNTGSVCCVVSAA